MSKIETALEKARILRSLGSGSTQAAGSQLIPVPKTTEHKSNYDVRAISMNIAKMEEPWELTKTDLAESKIIYQDMEDVSVTNAFRRVRTKILHKSNGNNCSVMVTSIDKNSGNIT